MLGTLALLVAVAGYLGLSGGPKVGDSALVSGVVGVLREKNAQARGESSGLATFLCRMGS